MNKRSTRKTNRLRQYDYSKAGYYFVTLCIQNRVCLLGNVVNDQMILNHAGVMIENSWRQVSGDYDEVEIDSWQIMPNHLHGIIILAEAGTGSTPSLSDVIGQFKSVTTNQYIGGVKHHQWHPFDKKLWQQSFHDHVIRNDQDLNRVREYIHNNPLKWALDEDNPDNWAQ